MEKKIIMNSSSFALKLDPSHKKQVIAVVNHRPSLFQKQALDRLDYFLKLDLAFPVLFGAFYQEKLISVLGLYKWAEFPYANFCYRFACVDEGAFFKSPLHNLCVEKAIKYGKEKGIKAYYLFQKRRPAKLYPRIYKQLPALKNWFAFTEAVIPANTKPDEDVYWDMMDKILRPYESEIRRFQPKPAFSDSVYWPPD